MPFLSITNQKGGVAKTTTSIHLAIAMAADHPDQKVLLVDLDSQQNATGVLSGNTEFSDTETSFDLFSGQVLSSRHLHAYENSNLYVVPASLRLVEVETMLAGQLDGFFRLKESLNKAKNEFSQIIFDCPPSLSMITINALVCADYVLVPMQVSKFSLDGLHRILDSVSTVKKRYNPNLEILGAVFSMHNENTSLSRAMKPQVEKLMRIFNSAIPRSVVVEEAHLLKKNLFDYAPDSKPAKQFRKLAEEVQHATK